MPASVVALFHLWFDDFKWKDYFIALISVYFAALAFCQQIGVPVRFHQPFAWAIVLVAAVLYVINPKNRDWVKAEDLKRFPAPSGVPADPPVTAPEGVDIHAPIG